MSFGERLKQRRKELGITQVQLADKLNVTKGAVGNYESGISSPKAEILYKVFDVLQCDANFLFQDEMQTLQKERPQTPDDAEVEANAIKLYEALLSSGFLKPGEDLTDRQLQVLDAISILIAASFESGTEQI